MRIECVEAFADASLRVLAATLGDEFGCGEPRLALREERADGVSVRVRFFGDHEGHVALGVDEATALRLFAVATGERHRRLPALGIDYFLELGTVIAGGAVSRLNELGFDVGIDPPELSAPTEAPEDAEVCRIPFYSAHGPVVVQVVVCSG